MGETLSSQLCQRSFSLPPAHLLTVVHVSMPGMCGLLGLHSGVDCRKFLEWRVVKR